VALGGRDEALGEEDLGFCYAIVSCCLFGGKTAWRSFAERLSVFIKESWECLVGLSGVLFEGSYLQQLHHIILFSNCTGKRDACCRAG
jgi:hypothetical protein